MLSCLDETDYQFRSHFNNFNILVDMSVTLPNM